MTVSSAAVTLPTLTVGVVRLREFTIGDTDALHRVYGDPVATRHLSFDARSREQVAEVLAGIIARRQADPRTEYALAVERLPGALGGAGDRSPSRSGAAPHAGAEVVPPRSEMLVPGTDAHPTGGEMIGMARLALGDHRSAQIGFALRPDQWRRGLGRQTVYLLLELAFEHLGQHRVWGARAPENEASRRVMLALGMVEEGRIRDHIPAPGGWRDSIVHSILEEEWRAGRQVARPAAAYADPS